MILVVMFIAIRMGFFGGLFNGGIKNLIDYLIERYHEGDSLVTQHGSVLLSMLLR